MTGSAARTVVITDCDHGTIAPEQQVLAGHEIELRLADCKTPRDVVEQARDADVLINQYAPITGEVLDGLPRCRLVVRYGVGVDNVDVPAATSRGVWVANVPDYGRAEVADHALALALTLLRGVA
jgi:D-3-phosphoglycerate dehydrogenase